MLILVHYRTYLLNIIISEINNNNNSGFLWTRGILWNIIGIFEGN